MGLIELSFALQLVASAVLGMVLGLERSLAGKHAGMRTYALVSLGSAAFCLIGTLASYQLSIFSGINPLQIAGSVVIGIGFIGSGLATMHGEHPLELTTASGIWVASAVGMACGFGMYIIAITLTVLSVVIFTLLSKVEYRLRDHWGVGAK